MDGSSVTSRSLTLLAICFVLTAKFLFLYYIRNRNVYNGETYHNPGSDRHCWICSRKTGNPVLYEPDVGGYFIWR